MFCFFRYFLYVDSDVERFFGYIDSFGILIVFFCFVLFVLFWSFGGFLKCLFYLFFLGCLFDI